MGVFVSIISSFGGEEGDLEFGMECDAGLRRLSSDFRVQTPKAVKMVV